MDIKEILLIILIVLVLILIFLVLNMKKNNNEDISYNIRETIIEKNSDTKNEILTNISDFKNRIKDMLYEDIDKLVNKVDDKLKESNKISSDTKEYLTIFKDKLEKDLDSDIDRLIEKVDNKFISSDKNIQVFRQELQKSIYDNLDKLTKKVEEKLQDGNEGIGVFKDTIKENISKDILNLGEKVEIRLKEGFETTDKTFKEVIERLAVMEKTQDNIIKLSENIIGLEKILSDKKSRGTFGELRLEQVLNNVYGDSGLYKMQYKLSNNKIADSAVYVNDKEKIVCIDSKFPLENYLKYMEDKTQDNKKTFVSDVKKHIDAISSKYIIDGETLNVAMLFLPSESIFMEIYNNFEEDILNYAYSKKVFIVSQRSLMIYISTVQLATINYKKNKNADKILDELNKFSKEFSRYEKRWSETQKDFTKIINDFNDIRITSEKITTRFNAIKNMVEMEN